MSVIVATAYMEEAERFDWLVAMNGGRILATGSPAEIKVRTGAASLEESFIALLPAALGAGHRQPDHPAAACRRLEVAVAAEGLTRRFGDFTAVDHVSFRIERGEIFGFLGSNGCGKTTTIKMLTGLLPASEGKGWLFDAPIDAADLELRKRVGYMSQSFSLYGELTVRQNLALHARLFHMAPDRAERRIRELVRDFGLAEHVDAEAAGLPLGIRQRLSLAVAVVHEPELLILDEPTSGVDPLARDRFWELLADLSRNKGVTIFVSTHFMNEAARCDRVSLMDSGRVLATGTPADLVAARAAGNLEEAFIGYIEDAVGTASAEPDAGFGQSPSTRGAAPSRRFSLGRLLAYSIRESLELWRDPVRLGFALLGTAFLMLALGTRDQHGCGPSALRRARPRRYAGEPRLSGGASGLDLLHRAGAAGGLRRDRAAPGRRRAQGGRRDSARLRARPAPRPAR